MGLVTCPDCKQQVSDKADKCPHCGGPVKKLETGAKVLGIVLILGLAAWALSLIRQHEFVWGAAAGGIAIGLIASMNKA